MRHLYSFYYSWDNVMGTSGGILDMDAGWQHRMAVQMGGSPGGTMVLVMAYLMVVWVARGVAADSSGALCHW